VLLSLRGVELADLSDHPSLTRDPLPSEERDPADRLVVERIEAEFVY